MRSTENSFESREGTEQVFANEHSDREDEQPREEACAEVVVERDDRVHSLLLDGLGALRVESDRRATRQVQRVHEVEQREQAEADEEHEGGRLELVHVEQRVHVA